RGHFEVRDASGRLVAELNPEKRVYRASGQPMTEAAIDRSLVRDIYVSMGEPLGGTVWAIRAHVKPLINWIWLGCVMMAGGGLLAVADKRYRRRLAQRESRAEATARA